MAVLEWDKPGERLYETGVKKVVLYPQAENGSYATGVAWNGVSAINESPSGADSNPIYADDIKYLDIRGKEEYGFGISAYMYPDEWMECDGQKEACEGVVLGQQTRLPFGLCYRTILGNDTKKEDYGYKLHLIYNATASPSSTDHGTVNESVEPGEMSWDCTTTPVAVPGYKEVSTITINSTKVGPEKMKLIEDKLYGTDSEEPTLPTPQEVIELLRTA